MRELRAAGYTTAMPDGIRESEGNSRFQMLLTFDDGFENVLGHGLEPMRESGFRAIQFLVPGLFGRTNEWETAAGEAPQKLMDAVGVREWLAAGHEIGAHTMTHPNLKRIPREQAREEIAASKKSLEDQFGIPIRHFCYPYGAENESVRDLVAEAGFETACTTRVGLNTKDTPALELRRLTARPVSVRFKDLWRLWLARPWGE
jgi:peptidoglycan/xylan/chitin deacetylase (PgdA/CDA1 family)